MNQMSFNKVKLAAYLFITVILTLGLSISFQSLLADWQAPTGNPPTNNTAEPLDVSVIGQAKQGGLILNTSGGANGLIVSSGNVGIGDNSPSSPLSINSHIDHALEIVTDSGEAEITLSDTTSSHQTWEMGVSSVGLHFDNFTDGGYALVMQQGTRNIGIGLANPTARLHIYGTSNSNDAFLQLNNGGDTTVRLGQDTASTGHNEGKLQLSDNGTLRTVIRAAGNSYIQGGSLGIGKNNPSTALDVNGTVTANNFSGNGSGLTNLNVAWSNLTGAPYLAKENIYFGGMYTWYNNQPNPLTGSFSCPSGYTSVSVYSNIDTSEDYIACLGAPGITSQVAVFGGMYNTGSGGGSHPNPLTGANSCPSGYSSYTFYGRFTYCYSTNLSLHAVTYFGGIYGSGSSINLATGGLACPLGYHDAIAHNYPVHYCYY